MKLVFATNNPHKLKEIRDLVGSSMEIVSLADIGCHDDIPETGKTLEENARQKAEYVYRHYHIDCFADDTGLEVAALNGAPGVHSARYAIGTDHDSQANMARLLHELQGRTDRKAQFRTVVCLILGGREMLFEGCVTGRIDTAPHGDEGFGYDPLFIPEGYSQSFAQLGEAEKNKISHRARAMRKLCEYLHTLHQ